MMGNVIKWWGAGREGESNQDRVKKGWNLEVVSF